MESINIFIITDFLSIVKLNYYYYGIFYLYYLNNIFMEYEK